MTLASLVCIHLLRPVEVSLFRTNCFSCCCPFSIASAAFACLSVCSIDLSSWLEKEGGREIRPGWPIWRDSSCSRYLTDHMAAVGLRRRARNWPSVTQVSQNVACRLHVSVCASHPARNSAWNVWAASLAVAYPGKQITSERASETGRKDRRTDLRCTIGLGDNC